MIDLIVSATVLGLAGGFGPGPLLALVVSETLELGLGAGIRVALAPALTDAPIILVSLLVLSRLSGIDWLLGSVSIVGGAVVMRMGYVGLRRGARDVASASDRPRSLQKGVVVNLLNPHPYVFWLSIGGPLTVRAAESSLPAAVVFVSVFYVLLLGSKVLVAWIASRSRPFLRGRVYDLAVRALGLLLCAFALILIRDGASMAGWF